MVANSRLREWFDEVCNGIGVRGFLFFWEMCTDNVVMVVVVGYWRFCYDGLSLLNSGVDFNLSLDFLV